jgi:hypothetical protein
MVMARAVALGINILSLNYVASAGLRINKNKGLAAYGFDCCQTGGEPRHLRLGLDSQKLSE